MPRAIWKGAITFGLVTIPVELLSATVADELAFHLLDSRDMSRVHNKRVNEGTGEEVPWERVVKGRELDDGRRVALTDEDFSAANVKATHTIDVLGAVCADEIAVEHFETPYFLVPEQLGAKAYALLREALRRAGRVAVGQIVIRSRQRLCALVPQGDGLVLEILRYAHELRDTSGLELPGSDLAALGVTEAEITLAGQLIAAIETDWDPGRYRDSYRDDLLALIARKADSGDVPAPQPAEATQSDAQVIDIVDLLKQSIEETRRAKAADDDSPSASRGTHGRAPRNAHG